MKKFWSGFISRFGVVREIMELLWANKRWWLIPMVILLLLLGFAIVFASTSAVGPFIYTLF